MATYVISDIHGQYNMFIELLDKSDLKDGYIICPRRYFGQRFASDSDYSEAYGNAKCNMPGW